jgi:integrase/recombinase XerC
MSLLPDVAAYITERSAGDWSPRTVASRRWVLERVARWLTRRGHRRWATVGGSDFDAYLLTLVERGQRRSSVQAQATAIKPFGAWLMRQGRVLRDPAALLHAGGAGEEPLPPPPLTEGQVAALFDLVPRRQVVDLRTRLHLELLYSCALRNAEAVALDVSDIDLTARTVLVREGKMGKSRLLPLLTGGLLAASEYLALRRELLRGPDHGALLLDRHGRRLSAMVIWRWLHRASQRLGIHAYPHLLRHSVAVHLLRRGADIRHIQHFLGHSDLETTKVYLRMVPGHLREDYDKAMPALLPEEGAVGGSPAGAPS